MKLRKERTKNVKKMSKKVRKRKLKSKRKKSRRKRCLRKGGDISGALVQMNSNKKYNDIVTYFPEAINISNNFDNIRNNNTNDWYGWLNQYFDGRDPNSDFGSVSLKESMK